MDVRDEIELLAEPELIHRVERLEAMGVRVVALDVPMLIGTILTLALVRRDEVLMQCVCRMEPVEQIDEMVAFYESAILGTGETRH